ncbi:type 4b pilus protein PilO2 [Xanthomonas perforans]|uniref:type 4b pilus protein PilO2 n=1 Tax=Xanthomonas perforans TaxID=442694 RepID=UPI00235A01AB|nr:type 4b pilus protein PilO2 [Xanthomonas perforans]MDC9654340.1 type 4b pilus protein PilO2 [Xanthomonas perforans]MEB2158979.1 type 4b pilus protein PilO2 [Xanthomonas campestris pv. campestris]
MSDIGSTDSKGSRFEVITVNGKSVGVGLTWQTISWGRNVTKAAKDHGRKNGFELVSICKTVSADTHGDNKVLAGYVRKEEAPKKYKGLYCLGTSLIGQLQSDFIACFKLDDGRYAMSASFKGAVLPKIGDQTGDAEYIRDQLLQLASLITAEGSTALVIIAPEDLEVPDCTDHRTLAELLPAKAFRKEFELNPVSLTVDWRMVIWCGAVVAVAVVLLAAYRKYEANQRELAEQAAAALEAKRLNDDAALRAVEQKQGLPQPWISQPAASSLVSACRAMLDDTPLSLGGWVLESVTCQVGSANATYRSIDGTPITKFTDAVAAFTGGTKPILRASGDAGVVGANVQLDADSSDALRVSDDAIQSLQNHIQAVGQGTLVLQATTGTPPEQPPPTWNTTPFSISTKFPPDLLLRDTDLSGVRITSVTTTLDRNAAELTWQVSGDIYGR